jgi:polyhydroxyalkanoate synthesis regulator phasin
MFTIQEVRKKEADNLKSFGELNREQSERESGFLSHLMGEASIEDLADFEADLTQRQSQTLFEITTEMEDTKNALKQAEQLVRRLKNHLDRLEGLQRVLTKQR